MDSDGLVQAASFMPFFPLIGAGIGLIVGICVWSLEQILPQLPSATIGVGLLILINGVQHMDGLLDFGDGVMFHGTRSGKLRVMRDPTTGAGGIALALVVLMITAFGISAIPSRLIIMSLTASESAAVFGMVLATGAGRSAHKGMNTIFVEAMHHQRTLRLIVAFITVLAVSILAIRAVGMLLVAGSILTTLVMLWVSNRNFGGITGDVLGAINEITRAVGLLFILVFLAWV
jgi:adenosylcobinamide-GDP ribazoletransferase